MDASAVKSGDRLYGITVLNKQRGLKICSKAVSIFCSQLLQSLEQSYRALSIVFVADQEILLMNSRYRGKSGITDVLSFSYGGVKIDGIPFLGEIVIAPAVAVRNAKRYGTVPEKEIRKLLIHGTLHLLGYDHEVDKGQMRLIQAKLVRRKFFRSSPAIMP
jgi:probable rRNA maturation factor